MTVPFHVLRTFFSPQNKIDPHSFPPPPTRPNKKGIPHLHFRSETIHFFTAYPTQPFSTAPNYHRLCTKPASSKSAAQAELGESPAVAGASPSANAQALSGGLKTYCGFPPRRMISWIKLWEKARSGKAGKYEKGERERKMIPPR